MYVPAVLALALPLLGGCALRLSLLTQDERARQRHERCLARTREVR